MTTRLEAMNMYSNSGRLYVIPTNPRIEYIQGTQSFDTTRQVSLLTSLDLHPHYIFLHVYNHVDHASVNIDLKNKPSNMPKLHATIDETPIEIAVFENRWNQTDVQEGQIFKAWFGGETYEERDQNYGSAQFTWIRPDANVNA